MNVERKESEKGRDFFLASEATGDANVDVDGTGGVDDRWTGLPRADRSRELRLGPGAEYSWPWRLAPAWTNMASTLGRSGCYLS